MTDAYHFLCNGSLNQRCGSGPVLGTIARVKHEALDTRLHLPARSTASSLSRSISKNSGSRFAHIVFIMRQRGILVLLRGGRFENKQ